METLEEIYTAPGSVAREGARWNRLVEQFQAIYGEEHRPHFVARAPGRVNIIGESVSCFPFLVLVSKSSERSRH